ncbi:MHYT domain-containing protein [Comamonas aquatilis]|uniref:MHYT domain-containing protein n=1 Tax=Comamonas aquatilis TaxID=1778406 RepID=UPI0039EFCE5C
MLAHFFWSGPSDASPTMGEHDPWLVLLSFLVSVIASSQALRLAALAQKAVTPQLRMLAIGSGSLSLGAGIWAMHFIAMLGYTPHADVKYDLPLTILSLFPGIAASAVVLALLARPRLQRLQLILGGILVGLGIAAMHYSGMAAMQTHSPHQYSAPWFALSLLVGAALAMLALWVRFGLARADLSHSLARKMGASIIMGGAIAGMHYTAMLALRVSGGYESALYEQTHGDDSQILALTIALVALGVGSLIVQANALLHYRSRWMIEDMNAAHLRALVQMAADGIICIDTCGIVLDYNPAAQRIFGWSAQEVIGRSVKMLMPAALADQHDHYVLQHEKIQQEGGPPLKDKVSEVLAQHKDGSLIPLRLALSQADARGQRMYVGILTDLSEQKKTARDLRIAVTVFEHSFEGVVVLDANRRVVDINPAYERMSGLARKTARNKEFSALYIDIADDASATASVSSIWTEVLRTGHWQGDWKLLHTGNPHHLSITAVRDEHDRVHHYIGVCYEGIRQQQSVLH